MKIYLAGIEHGLACYVDDIPITKKDYFLGSFYYFKPRYYKFINNKKFMLDSGAFTFMENKSKKTNWVDYVDRYAEFINNHNIDLFFELDIDNVVGIKKVEKLRKRLESKTDKKCIPVWHKSRGKQYFVDMCKSYDYVAIGGIVSNEFKKRDYKYFTWFINTAHAYDSKIHGLGLSAYKTIKKYKFDSVDSTGWTYGNIGGYLYKFNGQQMKKIESAQNIKGKKVARNNYKQWLKFQKYADKNIIKVYAKTTYKKLRERFESVKKILFLGRNINYKFSSC